MTLYERKLAKAVRLFTQAIEAYEEGASNGDLRQHLVEHQMAQQAVTLREVEAFVDALEGFVLRIPGTTYKR